MAATRLACSGFETPNPTHRGCLAFCLTLLPKQILRDMNTTKMAKGNYLADSLKLAGLVDEVARLRALDERQLAAVKLTTAERDTVITQYISEMQKLYMKFPDLRIKVYLPENAPKEDPADTLKQRPRAKRKKK